MAERPIILFDGMCNLCSSGVDFVIKRDKKGVFLFCPLHGNFAESLLHKHGISEIGNDTFILIKNNRCYFRSEAALEVLQHLSGFWPRLRYLSLVPLSIRDFIYNLIAQNRYKVFGRRKVCKLPEMHVRDRFLE